MPPGLVFPCLGADRLMLVPRLVVFSHVAGVPALIALAVYTLGLYCESFGCMGIGLMWMAWAVLFGVRLLFGLVSRAQSRKGSPRLVQIAALAVRAQWLLGGMAVIRWLLK